jgi:hypothetical protein
MKKKIAFTGIALTLPFLAFAQQITSVQTAGDFVLKLINTVAVPVLFGIAFIVFLYGIFSYFILSRGSEEKQGEARALVIYGFIGFFLMVVVWGVVNVLVGTFNFQNTVPSYPQTPGHG